MRGAYKNMGKRLIDLAAVLIAAPCAGPVWAVLFTAIRLKNGKPVLFKQLRPGFGGKPFRLIKFRTMSDLCNERGVPLPDEDRVTRLGAWLRRTSLDEVPTLWNVLTGDMSLIGPRPLLMQYLERYSPYQARRHEVKPGITGWAQVNGRNALSWEEKFKLDVWYVDHVSFWLDMKILWMTLWKVLKREGISAEGHATMPEFMGSECAEGQASHRGSKGA